MAPFPGASSSRAVQTSAQVVVVVPLQRDGVHAGRGVTPRAICPDEGGGTRGRAAGRPGQRGVGELATFLHVQLPVRTIQLIVRQLGDGKILVEEGERDDRRQQKRRLYKFKIC